MFNSTILRNLAAPVFLLGIAVPASAQEIEVYVFKPPEIDRVTPHYPEVMLDSNREAWVEVNFMVNTEGKAFEASVINSTGDDDFHKNALSAINNGLYIPATNNGEPIVGSMTVRVRFNIEGATGARSSFRRAYREFTTTLETASEEEASAALTLLTSIGGMNHYENAYYNFARFMYAQKFTTTTEQQFYLEAALSFTNSTTDEVYLAEDQALYARRELLKFQVTNKYYREALATFEYLQESGDTETVELFSPVKEAITRLQQDETSYGIPVTLDDSGHWNFSLFKNKVYAENVNGKLHEFKLRCDKNFVGFVVEPDISYDIPAALGDCDLEIIGDAGTTFVLVQH